MWKNHCNVFDSQIYDVRNDIQKPFQMGILNYTERMREMFEMAKLLPPPNRKN